MIPVWKQIDLYGIDLPGFYVGNLLDIRLWNHSEQFELKMQIELSSDVFGEPLIYGSASIDDIIEVPDGYYLGSAFPNPFNPVTSIDYAVPYEGIVSVGIYDINGKLVKEIVNDSRAAGFYTAVWNAADHSSGLYFIKLTAESFSEMQKIMLIK